MNQLHTLPRLCDFAKSRTELAKAFQVEKEKDQQKKASMGSHMMMTRLYFFLRCLYMNGNVDNQIARHEVMHCYKDIQTLAITYLKDFHNTENKEIPFAQEQAPDKTGVLDEFERRALSTGDLQRHRDRTSILVIDIVS